MTGKGDTRVPRPGSTPGERGIAMVALLVGIAIMAVALTVALPTWKTLAQRERETELVFRGEQYARAIALYQRKYANAFPPNIDILVDQKFLRKKYKDPITNADFQLLLVGQTPPGQGTAQAGGGPQGGRAGGPQTGTALQQGRGTGAAAPSGLSATPLGGTGGIMGVSSKSDATSFREYKGRMKYNEWVFVAVQATTNAGAPTGGQNPNGGVPGGDGRAGRGGRGGPGGGLQPFGGGQGDCGRGGNPPAGPGRGTQPFGGGGLQPLGGRGGRL